MKSQNEPKGLKVPRDSIIGNGTALCRHSVSLEEDENSISIEKESERPKKILPSIKIQWEGQPIFSSLPDNSWMLSAQHLRTMTLLLGGSSALNSWWIGQGSHGQVSVFDENQAYSYNLNLIKEVDVKGLGLNLANKIDIPSMTEKFSNLAAAINLLFSICSSYSKHREGAFVLSARNIAQFLNFTDGAVAARLERIYEAIRSTGSFFVRTSIKSKDGTGSETIGPKASRVWNIDFELGDTPDGEKPAWAKLSDFYVSVKPGAWVTVVGGDLGFRSRMPSSILPAIARADRYHDLLGSGLSDVLYRIGLGKGKKSVYGRDLIKILMGYRTDSELAMAERVTDLRSKMADRFNRFLCEASRFYLVKIQSKRFLVSSGLYLADDSTYREKAGKMRRPKGFFSSYRDTAFVFILNGQDSDFEQELTSVSETKRRWLERFRSHIEENQIRQADIAAAINRSQSFVSKALKGTASFSRDDQDNLNKRFLSSNSNKLQ